MDYTNYIGGGLVGLFIFIMGFIEVPKLKLNIWSYILRQIGKALNGDLNDKIDQLRANVNQLQSDLNQHIKDDGEEKARASRYRILRCDGELRNGVPYTREAFDELLEDIKRYKKFCDEHEDFKNYKAVFAIDHILEEYADYTRNDRFLK